MQSCWRSLTSRRPQPHGLVGQVPFSSTFANFPFSLFKWKLWRSLSLALLSEIGNCVAALLYYCELACENLLWLFCDCRPAPYPRRGTHGASALLPVLESSFLFFCDSIVDLESFIKCVRSFLPFLFLRQLSFIFHFNLGYPSYAHSCLLLVCQFCSEGSLISFRSHNGDVSSYHVWHLGFDAAVFGLLGFFQTALGGYPSARILAFTRAQSLHWNKALGPHAGISFYSQELVLPCLFT